MKMQNLVFTVVYTLALIVLVLDLAYWRAV